MTTRQFYHLMTAAFLLVGLIISAAAYAPVSDDEATTSLLVMSSIGISLLINLYYGLKPFSNGVWDRPTHQLDPKLPSTPFDPKN